ncbi:MAG TPA: L-aspartate oxidase [Lachnospiraceae bacterium]|nr:L-aspartate oxidase [Lachnospiraceae bacterium]
MKNKVYDVIIVGTGAAGLFSALALPRHCSILMITKDALKNSDSYLAQGGIAALKNETDFESYFEDTMKAGRYENNKESVRVMIESSQEIIKDLIHYGVDFDLNEDGSFAYTREGAHSTFRILHHKAVTGKEITSKLLNQVEKRKNIELLEYTTMIDLISDKESCKGIVIENQQGVTQNVFAKTVILATGGIGGLFDNSTNFSHITGDSFAIALKHNVELENMHYIQIHPTALYTKKKGRKFLISESVRGEGAILLNHNNERFVDELLPRDVVTAAIKKEMDRLGTDHVYLSVTHLPADEVKERFPNIYKKCLEEGYDMTKEPIPVAPAQHYLMGGIKVDTQGTTTLPKLYAVGETACNGVHGANRLASNSLLESLVFAKRAAQKITSEMESEQVIGTEQALSLEDIESSHKVLDEKANQDRAVCFRQLIFKEIKREDESFYVRWCNNAYQHR